MKTAKLLVLLALALAATGCFDPVTYFERQAAGACGPGGMLRGHSSCQP